MNNENIEDAEMMKKFESHYSNNYFDSWVDHSVSSSENLLKIIFDLYSPRSVADFGCGRGAWLATCEKLGAEVLHGYDGLWVDKEKFLSKKIFFTPVNFEDGFSPKVRYDLAISVEVAEHISSAGAENFVSMLTLASDVVIFGAAAKNQGGENHINEQWQNYWIDKFKDKGYECFDIFRPSLWNNNQVDWWYRQNTFLFVKKDTAGNIFDLQKVSTLEKVIYNIVHPESFEYRLGISEELKKIHEIEIKKYKDIIEIQTNRIEAMCNSKFWKIRDLYMNIKSGQFIKRYFSLIKHILMLIFKKIAEKVIFIILIPEYAFFHRRQNIKIDNDPLVSVVIPCYNYGRYIEEAIDSVLASTYQNIEIIVVDDGPTDPFTIELLKNLKKPKTRVIFQENQGLAKARNNGIAAASGTYVLPLDADDKIDPTYIEKALYTLQLFPLRSFVYPYVQLFGAESSVWYTGEYDLNRLKKENIIPSCTLFRKKAWEISGGYNNDRHQYDDWTFWLKMGMNGFYGKLIPEILFFHRKHEGQENMTTRLRERHKEYCEKIKNDLPGLFKGNSLVNKISDVIRDAMFWQREKFEIRTFEKLSFKPVSPKRKLLVFLPWTIRGGAEKVTLDVIKNLSDWDIFVVTTLKNDYDPEVDLAFKSIAKNVYHLPNYFSSENYLTFVEHLMETQNIKTVLINHCAWAYKNTEHLKNKFQETSFFDLLHNTMEGGYKDWSKKYSRWLDKTIVISDELKQNLTKELGFPAEKVVCILNGVDVDHIFNPRIMDKDKIRKELGLPENKKIFAFIGRLSQEKDPLKFIELAHKIDQAFPGEYFFTIAGDGNLMQKASNAANRYLKQKNFIFLGNYSNPEKVLMLAHFLVNTSKIEGMPLTIIEALAMEVPVIAPAIGAISEIVQDGTNGFLLKRNADLAEYIEAIKKMRDEKIYARIKENTRQSVVEKYSARRMAEEYEKVFKVENNYEKERKNTNIGR